MGNFHQNSAELGTALAVQMLRLSALAAEGQVQFWSRNYDPTSRVVKKIFLSAEFGKSSQDGTVGRPELISSHGNTQITATYLAIVNAAAANTGGNQLFMTPWTVARQAPLSVGFSRQGCWSGLPFPPPGDLSDPGIRPVAPALQAGSLPLSHGEAPIVNGNDPKTVRRELLKLKKEPE